LDIRTEHRTTKTAVVTYADEVTSFVTAPTDIPTIRDHLLPFERATGTCLNMRKPKAMTAGSWDTSMNILSVPYYQDTTIHGFEFMCAVACSRYLTCSKATGKIPGERGVGAGPVSKATLPVRAYLSTLQDMAHNTDFPDSDGARTTNLNDNNLVSKWFGAIFRAPLSTTQRRTEDEKLDLLDVVSKCRVLFIRFRTQGDKSLC